MKIRWLFLIVAFVFISLSYFYCMSIKYTMSGNCRSSAISTEELRIETLENAINEIIKELGDEREAIAEIKNNLESISESNDEVQKIFDELAFNIRHHWQELTYGFRARKGIELRLKDLLAKVSKNGQLKTKIQNQLNEVQKLVNQIEALKEEAKKQTEKRSLRYLEPTID